MDIKNEDLLLAEMQEESSKKGYPTREEMVALNLRRLDGDAIAREEMILRNDNLVKWVVGRSVSHLDPGFHDQLQAGRIGLMNAVDKFDHSLGNSFATFAFWQIRSLSRQSYLKESRMIRLPGNVQTRIRKLRKIAMGLEQKLGRRPDLEEIAEESGFTVDDIRDTLESSHVPMSLDRPLQSEDGEHGNHHLKTPDPHASSPDSIVSALDEAKEAFKWLLDLKDHLEHSFKPVDRRIFFARYGIFGGGLKKTLEQTGKMFGRTRERVRQICKKVFLLRSQQGLPIGTEDELKQALHCLQTGMELEFANYGTVPQVYKEVFGESISLSTSSNIPIKVVPVQTPRVLKEKISTSYILEQLKHLVMKHVTDPNEIRKIVCLVAREDFNIPVVKLANILRWSSEKPLSETGLNEKIRSIRSSYTLAMHKNNLKSVWEKQGKLFPSQLPEIRELQIVLQERVRKANEAIEKDTKLPLELREAMCVRYGVGREVIEDNDIFCKNAGLDKIEAFHALQGAWNMLVTQHELELQSDLEYHNATEDLLLLSVLIT